MKSGEKINESRRGEKRLEEHSKLTRHFAPLRSSSTRSPKSGLIPPFGSISSTVTFSAKPEGLVGLSLPVNVKGSNPNLSSSIIRLSADVIGPRLRIDQSEVDFGLVAVGGNKKFTVTFRNEGCVPLAWACLYLSKSDAMDEKLAALSAKLGTAPGKSVYGRKTTRGMSLMSSASR